MIVVGSSLSKGTQFLKETNALRAIDRAVFIQADLRLTKENKRIIREIKKDYRSKDELILCAASHKYRESITIT